MRNAILGSIAALGLLATPAIAQTTAGGGVSASSPRGSVAGGVSAGTADKQERKRSRNDRRGDREQDSRANSATTYGSGTVYTDRHRATGGVTAGASASGTSNQSAATAIDAYGRTTRDGSDAEVFGESDARSGN